MLDRARRRLDEVRGYLVWGDPLQNQARLVDLLGRFDDWCAARALTYWIDFGVLLGAHRHGRLIPWDHDLDVGMLRSDFTQLVEESGAAGSVDGLSFRWACPGCYRVGWRDVWIDVFEYDRRGELLCPTISIDDREGDPAYADHPRDDVFPLGRLSIGGRSVPAPRDSDACLRRIYGDYRRLPRIPLAFLFLYHPLHALELARRR